LKNPGKKYFLRFHQGSKMLHYTLRHRGWKSFSLPLLLSPEVVTICNVGKEIQNTGLILTAAKKVPSYCDGAMSEREDFVSQCISRRIAQRAAQNHIL